LGEAGVVIRGQASKRGGLGKGTSGGRRVLKKEVRGARGVQGVESYTDTGVETPDPSGPARWGWGYLNENEG